LRCLAPAIQEVPQQFASSNNADGNTAENQPRSQCGNIARAWCGRCAPHRSESPFTIQFNSSSQDSVHDKRTKLDPSINLSQLSLCLPLSSITTAFIFPSLCYVKHRNNTHKIDLRQSTQQSRIFTSKPNKLLELRSQGIVASSNAIEIALTKAQVIHRITERTKISGIAATSARQARDRRRNYSKMTNTLVCDSFKARKVLFWYLCHRPELSTELR